MEKGRELKRGRESISLPPLFERFEEWKGGGGTEDGREWLDGTAVVRNTCSVVFGRVTIDTSIKRFRFAFVSMRFSDRRDGSSRQCRLQVQHDGRIEFLQTGSEAAQHRNLRRGPQ